MVTDSVTWDGYARGWSDRHGGLPLRRGSALGRWLQVAYAVARGLDRIRVRPTGVTIGRVLISATAPVFVYRGGVGLPLAAVVVLVAAFADSVDGALAILQRRTSRLGFYYDAVADRLVEVGWLLALLVAGAPGWLVAAGGALSWLHEYSRLALLTATGRGAVSPWGERPTRVISVVAGLGLAWLAGLVRPELSAGVVTLAAAGWLLFSAIGLIRLLRLGQRALR